MAICQHIFSLTQIIFMNYSTKTFITFSCFSSVNHPAIGVYVVNKFIDFQTLNVLLQDISCNPMNNLAINSVLISNKAKINFSVFLPSLFFNEEIGIPVIMMSCPSVPILCKHFFKSNKNINNFSENSVLIIITNKWLSTDSTELEDKEPVPDI